MPVLQANVRSFAQRSDRTDAQVVALRIAVIGQHVQGAVIQTQRNGELVRERIRRCAEVIILDEDAALLRYAGRHKVERRVRIRIYVRVYRCADHLQQDDDNCFSGFNFLIARHR